MASQTRIFSTLEINTMLADLEERVQGIDYIIEDGEGFEGLSIERLKEIRIEMKTSIDDLVNLRESLLKERS